jgi:hypothetical protein
MALAAGDRRAGSARRVAVTRGQMVVFPTKAFALSLYAP